MEASSSSMGPAEMEDPKRAMTSRPPDSWSDRDPHRYAPAPPYPPPPPYGYPYPPVQQQQQPPPLAYPPPSWPEPPPEDSSTTTALKSSLLFTAGGLLGLSAAAAVRWLNGGDFSLMPPLPSEPPPEQELSHHHPTSNNNNNNNILVTTVQNAVSDLQYSAQRQEQMLQRITSELERRVTDESMDRLRPKSVAATLSQLHQELSCLRQDLNKTSAVDNNWDDSQLSSILERIHTCLDEISGDKAQEQQASFTTSSTIKEEGESNNNNNNNNKSMETSMTDDNDDSGSDEAPQIAPCLGDAIRRLVQENDPDSLRSGAQLLYLYVVNLSTNPRVPRYRKIFTSNESFQKVDRLQGGRELLRSLGFVEAGNYLEFGGSFGEEEEEQCLLERFKHAAAVLKILKTATSSTNNNNNHNDNDDYSNLLEMALSAAHADSEQAVTPPLSPPVKDSPMVLLSTDDAEEGVVPVVPQTPEGGAILSPPVPKKQTFPLDSEFPPLDQLVLQPELSASTSEGDGADLT